MKKDQNITFMTTKENKEILLKIAQEEERTLSWIVHKIINEYLNDYKK